MESTKVKLLMFVIFIVKLVSCTELDLRDEMDSATDVSTYLGLKLIFKTVTKEPLKQKCCASGYQFMNNPGKYCVPSNKTQSESETPLNPTPIDFKKLCVQSENLIILIDGADDETLWISKQGNLLIKGINYSSKYERYCVDHSSSHIIAMACMAIPEPIFIAKVIPICMCISVPLLFAVAIIYLIVPKLRNVHGETLALYAVCLGIGYMLMAYDKLTSTSKFGSGIHFFVLSSFCWLLMMTVDITYHLWSYYQHPNQFQQSIMIRLTIYTFLAFGGPALLVVAIHSGQTETKPIQHPLAQIMIPISVILIFNFLMLIPIYKYYTKCTLRSILKDEVKQRAKSLIWILIIIATNWLFEIVGMVWQNLRLALLSFPTLNGLQGVVLLCVFVLMPHYTKIIKAWWIEKNYSRSTEQADQDQISCC